MVNKPLCNKALRPYSWAGYVRGGRLTSHHCFHSINYWRGLEKSRGIFVKSTLWNPEFYQQKTM